MNCFDCASLGKYIDAVAVCTDCGAALCAHDPLRCVPGCPRRRRLQVLRCGRLRAKGRSPVRAVSSRSRNRRFPGRGRIPLGV
jgi:hypothetical protein